MPDDPKNPRRDADVDKQTDPAREWGERNATGELIAGNEREPGSDQPDQGSRPGEDRRQRE